MAQPERPFLASGDDLTREPGLDPGPILAELAAQRYRSPIVRPSTAEQVASRVDLSFPYAGNDDLDRLAGEVIRLFDDFPRRNTHPGFFGWVSTCGLPTDPLSQAMVSAINANVAGYWASPAGTVIERHVIDWLARLAGLPQGAEGVLLSGGSVANMTGIATALAHRYGPDYRRRGIDACAAGEAPAILCSQATHFSVRRAAAMLGVGTDNVIEVETDGDFRLRADRLSTLLETHANVFCVVASAGTTNTGAIDPLENIAELCREHGVWLHVDAAYGGGGLMSDELRPRYRGIGLADSITMDLHKWFYQSLDGSVLLYRDASAPRDLFYDSSDYLVSNPQPSPEEYMFFHLGPELSRRFRALPFYLALRHYGIERLGRNVLHNVKCAEYLAQLIGRHGELELVTGPQLSILCFRYRRPGLCETETDRLNSEIRDRIQQEGDYLMSATRVNGRPVLRVCIANHATRAAHVEGLLESVLRIGRELE